MSSDVDTSAEAVERLAHGCDNFNGVWLVEHGARLAATLRALLAERNALAERVRRIEEASGPEELCEAHCPHGSTLRAERNAAQAEVARLREEVTEARAQALEEAAAVVDSTVTYDQRAAGYAMRRIRALKEAPHD